MKNAALDFINRLAKKVSAKTYLEIGVQTGKTFFNVEIPHKTAVDPNFLFSIDEHKEDLVSYFPLPSDKFFEKFPEIQKDAPYNATKENFTFDIIFIDGLHTYAQSYRDFLNSLPYSHKDTVWIIDDTIPWDPFSAHPNQNISLKYRNIYGIAGTPWHGDVYKTIFAIHEFKHEFSYATHIDFDNPQTVLWKTSQNAVRREYGQAAYINNMTVFDLYENIAALNPMNADDILHLIGKRLDDSSFCYVDTSKFIRMFTTVPEIKLRESLNAEKRNFQNACYKEIKENSEYLHKLEDKLNELASQNLNVFPAIDAKFLEQSQKIAEISEQVSEIKRETDLLETKRRNIVRHLRSNEIRLIVLVLSVLITIILLYVL